MMGMGMYDPFTDDPYAGTLIDDGYDVKLIHTLRGAGYRLGK